MPQFTRIAVTGLVSAALAVVGGCDGMSSEEKGIFGGLGAGGLAGGIAKAAGADTDTSLAIGAGVGLATAVAIYVIEERQATAQEQQTAKEKAAEQLEPVSDEEKAELKKQNTYVAVPVDEGENDQQGVMVVDPETGEPVNDTVYVVDSSDPNVDSGEKVDIGGYDAIYVD